MDIRCSNNTYVIANIIICLTVLPNVFSVLLGLFGIKSYVSLYAYAISVIFLIKLSHPHRLRFFASLFLYLFWFYCSYSYTISKVASTEKLMNVSYMILIPLIIVTFAYSFCYNPKGVEDAFIKLISKWSNYILLILALMLIVGITEKGDSFEERETIIGFRNPIWCSRFAGFLIIPTLLNIFNRKYKKLDFSGCIAAAYIMIVSGSRAPILSIIMVLLLTIFPNVKMKYKLLMCLLFLIIVESFLLFSTRYSSGSADYSDVGRLELINGVLEAQFNIFSGVGIGGYNLYITGFDTLFYPHNVFLETYIEVGVIGLLLFVSMLYSVYRSRHGYKYLYAYFLFFFFNSLFSGDISSNNLLFIFSALLFLSNKNRMRKDVVVS